MPNTTPPSADPQAPLLEQRPAPDAPSAPAALRLGLPKGRMHDQLVELLAQAGIRLRQSSRGYRPAISLPGVEVKILKPQNIVQMLHAGTRDAGFAGADWVHELDTHLVEVLDTTLDPVRIVLALPRDTLTRYGGVPTAAQLGRPLRIAGEMEILTRTWMRRNGLVEGRDAVFVRTYGATEVFPPEDADGIVDVTASGATLEANDLDIVEDVMLSSTRLYASRAAWSRDDKRERIEQLALLLTSVLEARTRVMLELNVSADALEGLVRIMPCMREPTVGQLHGGAGYAVKSAVPKKDLPTLIPMLRAAGGTDIVISPLLQVVP